MAPDPVLVRPRAPAIAVASLVPAVVGATQDFARGNPVEPSYFAFVTLGALALLVALTAMFDRFMHLWTRSARVVALFTVVAIGLGAVLGLAGWAIAATFDLPLVAPGHRSALVVARIGAVNGLLGLGLWAMAVVFPFAVRDAQARAVEADRLRASAELARLRMSLQPHFLFNTLSTVSGLIGEDPREARRLIGALGDLLRDSLGEADEMQTLDDEVRWLQRYASILETRHRGSISFRWDIADATRTVRIPRLLLQPLVENAVKHGALRREEGGEVSVRTLFDAGRTICIVEDNGPGAGSDARRPGAKGVELVVRRLALRYAGSASFRFESSERGARSVVTIPSEPS